MDCGGEGSAPAFELPSTYRFAYNYLAAILCTDDAGMVLFARSGRCIWSSGLGCCAFFMLDGPFKCSLRPFL